MIILFKLSLADLQQLADHIADRLANVLASQPRLVDRHELAKFLGVSVTTIERLQRRGAIPAVNCGRLVRYSPEAVVAALNAADAAGGAA